jgi:hypothetical protein
MEGETDLDAAYRYPFSAPAKKIVASQPNEISMKYLEMGKRHVETAINEGLEYKPTKLSYAKLDYLMAYLYSRMIVSAVRDILLIRAYAVAEAERSVEAAYKSSKEEVVRFADWLGLGISARFGSGGGSYDEFAVRFDNYLNNAPPQREFELVNQKLGAGTVIIDRDRLRGFLEGAASREIMKGLPIKAADLPREVVGYCKTSGLDIKREDVKARKAPAGESAWIERLLRNPIPDVRHRTVNLILAPYLTNMKGMNVEEATRVIVDYIEKCKQIDPSTKITSSYIRYQCDYSKKKGMKPLSFERAKELLQGALDIEAMR